MKAQITYAQQLETLRKRVEFAEDQTRRFSSQLDAARAETLRLADQVIDLLGLRESYPDETQYYHRGRPVTEDFALRSGWAISSDIARRTTRGAETFIGDVKKAVAANEGRDALKKFKAALKEAQK